MRSFVSMAVLLVLVAAAPSWAGLGEVAIFSEGVGWIAQDAADEQRQILYDSLDAGVPPVDQVLWATDAEIGPWAEGHINDGSLDVMIIFGWFPTTLYTPGNSQADGSIAEEFLYGGDIIINCADYIFYVTEGGGANGDAGLKNITNTNADCWGDNTMIEPTAQGEAYTPTLEAFQSNRPLKPAQFDDTDWEVEVMFGQDPNTEAFDPGFIKLKDNNGRIGICQQVANDALPRGQILIEMLSYLDQVATAVEAQDKLATSWGTMKSE